MTGEAIKAFNEEFKDWNPPKEMPKTKSNFLLWLLQLEEHSEYWRSMYLVSGQL